MKSRAVALLLVLLLTLSGVHAKAPRVTLSYWCSPFPNEAGWAITVTRLWNATHADVQVRLQSIPQGRLAEEVIREAIRNHKTPDVTSHLFPANTEEFVRMGGLLPLDGYKSLVAVSEGRSGTLSGFRATDGHLYQIPWKCNPILMEYNATLLKKYGLKAPRTYGDFLSAAEVLRKKAGIYAWAPDPNDTKWWNRYYDFYPLYLAASGGKPFTDSVGRPAFNNAAGVSVMEFLGKTFRGGYAPSTERFSGTNALNEAFASGKIAFLVTGPWNAPITQEMVGNTLSFDFCPLPVPDGTNPRAPVYTYGNFRNLGMFATCEHRVEAAAFLEFLISKQADVAFLEMSSELPYRLSLATDPAFASLLRANKHLNTFARQVPYVRPVENTPSFNKILNALSRQYAQSAVRGSKSAAQAVKDAADEVHP